MKETDKICTTQGEHDKFKKNCCQLKRKYHLDELGMGGRKILKYILKKNDV
jgi:hypothetical protein